MQIIKCKNCGAQLDVTSAADGIAECGYCHSKHILAKSASAEALNFLAMGEHCLDTCKFDDAISAYGKAAQIDPTEPEAYFGTALSEFKVQYIKDIVNNRLQPICHDVSAKKFSQNGNYIKALSLAAPRQKAEYERRAAEIDYIRSEFYKLKKQDRDYDCFICVKVSGENGRKTVDSERANDIYFHLKDRGYKPFYSEREIQNETGADYEARILYALFCSPCMLIVCSDESYLQTPWVKNEYTRFINLINDERKETDSIAIGFFDAPIERLPNRNGRLQGVCLNRPDAYSKIVDFVNNCSPIAKQRKAQMDAARKAEEEELKRRLSEQAAEQTRQMEELKRQQERSQKELQEKLASLQSQRYTSAQTVSIGCDVNVQSLLMRVNQFLDAYDFINAKNYCNRVLDIDPNNGEAWMGLLMIKFNAYSPTVLLNKIKEQKFETVKQVEDILNSFEYKNACKYSNKHTDLIAEIDSYLVFILNKIKCDEDMKRFIEEEARRLERINIEEQNKRKQREEEANRIKRAELEVYNSKKRKKISKASFLFLLPAIALCIILVIVLIRPSIVFSAIHYGWLIGLCTSMPAVCIILCLLINIKIGGLSSCSYGSDRTYGVISSVLTVICHSACVIMMVIGLVSIRLGTVKLYHKTDFNAIKNMPIAKRYELINDIDFHGEEMIPIKEIPNYCVFNGNNHSIKNFVCKTAYDVSEGDYGNSGGSDTWVSCGIVAVCKGVIENITVSNGVYVPNYTEDTGRFYTSLCCGGVSGILFGGVIRNCKILNCDINLEQAIGFRKVHQDYICAFNFTWKGGLIENCEILN